MCLSGKHVPTAVCTLGNLQPGQRYENPEGEEYIVTNLSLMGDVNVVSLRTGVLQPAAISTTLGYRPDGYTLCAYRRLNPVPALVEVADPNV